LHWQNPCTSAEQKYHTCTLHFSQWHHRCSAVTQIKRQIQSNALDFLRSVHTKRAHTHTHTHTHTITHTHNNTHTHTHILKWMNERQFIKRTQTSKQTHISKVTDNVPLFAYIVFCCVFLWMWKGQKMSYTHNQWKMNTWVINNH
jgi:hypothetical protein